MKYPLYEINKGRSAGYTTLGCIEGRVVPVLRDTGSDVTIIRKSVVVNPKYTGEYQVCVGAFGHTVRLPVALVYLSTVHGKGETKCCISPDLVVACILGNKTVGEWKKKVVSTVQTRSQKKLEVIPEEIIEPNVLTPIEVPLDLAISETKQVIGEGEKEEAEVREGIYEEAEKVVEENLDEEITAEEFRKCQNEDEEIQGVINQEPGFFIEDGLVFRRREIVKLAKDPNYKVPRKKMHRKNKAGEERAVIHKKVTVLKQLVVPHTLVKRVLSLAMETLSLDTQVYPVVRNLS